MKKNKIMTMMLIGLTMTGILAGCGFGNKEEDQMVVSPTPEAVATPTPVAALESTSYTSADKAISIELPDTSWAVKTDKPDMLSFESADQGKILIMHEADEKDIAATLIPNTEDLAKAMAKSDGIAEEDFEIKGFTANKEGEMMHYAYTVAYKDPSKAKGNTATVYDYLVADKEFYSVEATVKSDDPAVLANIQKSIASIKYVALEKTAAAAAQKKTEATPTPEPEAKGAIESLPQEVLSDTSKTRTIYRNSDGLAIPIMLDGSGQWVDENGNVYRFSETEPSAAYDAQDTDYYYGGEGADVYFMAVPGSSDGSDDSGSGDSESEDYDYDSGYDNDYYSSGYDSYYDSYDNGYDYDEEY